MGSKDDQPRVEEEGHSSSPSSSTSIPSPGGEDCVEDMQLSDKELSTATQGSHRNCEKYNLRRSSVRVRVQTEQKKQQPKPRKAKSRPPPLSKYRRRTANARERSRMAEINDAFQELKQALPQDSLDLKLDDNDQKGSSKGKNSTSKSSQPTKATVLRLAIDYIAALRDILGYNAGSSSGSSSSSSSSSGVSSSGGSSCGGSNGDVGDPLSDDLGSDAASSTTLSSSSGSGDEESLMSSDLDTGGMMCEMDAGDLTAHMDSIVMEDLDFFDSSLTADFSPELSPDFSATLSPDEEVCLQLVTSVL